ncbi:MAG: RNA methyltransferase [Odoribacteraceae bacterium]|jgi:tRNA G18 (ribose-2'-O)-methylase SpoU|nr:RNA methyltransferase [Odoribacteraceae bacterium]
MARKLRNEELGRLSVEAYRGARKLPVVVVLDNVRSQHNVGAVFRTADAFRVEKIFLCGITATPPHREIYKTALGAEESVAWEYVAETGAAARRLKEEGYAVVAAEQVEGSAALEEWRLESGRRYAFVFGNEVRGVSEEVVALADYCLEVPQFGTKHSLNLSVTAGIVLWHSLHPLFGALGDEFVKKTIKR